MGRGSGRSPITTTTAAKTSPVMNADPDCAKSRSDSEIAIAAASCGRLEVPQPRRGGSRCRTAAAGSPCLGGVGAAVFGSLEQATEVVVREDGNGRFGDSGRLHPLHRRPIDFTLIEGPFPELLQGAELDRDGGRLDLFTPAPDEDSTSARRTALAPSGSWRAAK